MDKFDIILFIALILLSAGCYTLGQYRAVDLFISHMASNPKIVQTNTTCVNLSFVEAVKCLNDDFKTWFNYNVTNHERGTMTEAELKAQGGACAQASRWYIQKAHELGFQGQPIDIYESSGNSGHEIAMLYDDNLTAYCLVDQKIEPKCTYLNKS